MVSIARRSVSVKVKETQRCNSFDDDSSKYSDTHSAEYSDEYIDEFSDEFSDEYSDEYSSTLMSTVWRLLRGDD
jgi:hypothetical protein